MDYWRVKYLIPAINSRENIALIGIGDASKYLQYSPEQMMKMWDPYIISRKCSDYCIYDIDEKVIKLANQHGINAAYCDITKSTLGRQFKYIFASDVIEHVHNPVAFLSNITQSLEPQGLLVITTPNSVYWRNCIIDSYQEFPEHLFCFNQKHLKNLASTIGLEVVELTSFQTTEGLDTWRKKIIQPFHKLMVKLGRGNSLVMAARKNQI